MRSVTGILLFASILAVVGCSKTWDDHYNKVPDTINTSVWDAIQGDSKLSRFVEVMKQYKYDTLFASNNTYTLFIPDNTAIDGIIQPAKFDTTNLNYLISKYFIQPNDISGKRKLQMLGKKFALFDNTGTKPSFDGVTLDFESPLYVNGKYFIMNSVPQPRLNLYQFFKINNPVLKSYIDKKDSIILDQEKSRPIGFDENGNTVYDTVSITENLFELKYFAVTKEYRTQTATFVYPRLETYNNALAEMAQKLGGNFNSASDIPVKWQEDVLIPFLLDHGTFLNMLEPSEFPPVKIKKNKQVFNMLNILGDSIVADYVPVDGYLCSNGVTYDYQHFSIPDSLYNGAEKFEGEWLARASGANKYVWRSNVQVTSSSAFAVLNSYIKGMSNDSIMGVNFNKGYSGTFSLQFRVKNLFPRRYRMVVTTHMDIGGLYDIYVDNQLVKTFDYYEYIKSRGLIKSVTGATFVPNGRYNKFDCYVDNITEYEKPSIRFEYKGPGTSVPQNGLVIDVIEFVPVLE